MPTCYDEQTESPAAAGGAVIPRQHHRLVGGTTRLSGEKTTHLYGRHSMTKRIETALWGVCWAEAAIIVLYGSLLIAKEIGGML